MIMIIIIIICTLLFLLLKLRAAKDFCIKQVTIGSFFDLYYGMYINKNCNGKGIESCIGSNELPLMHISDTRLKTFYIRKNIIFP